MFSVVIFSHLLLHYWPAIVTSFTFIVGPERGLRKSRSFPGKYALNWTRLSCKHFISNQVRLGLFFLAYNLGNFLRRLVLPGEIKHWSLRSLLIKHIKIGAKVLRRSRYITFQMAEVAINKEIFAEILSRINRLRC
jgi:hypothetical protein